MLDSQTPRASLADDNPALTRNDQTASFLAADFGSVTTRAVLVDVVDGVYRLVARGQTQTTIGYPFNDVGVGLQRILHNISNTSGRVLLDDDWQLITPENTNRRGVDYFLATASAGRPLRTILVGVLPDVSLASASRAVAGTYIEPIATFHIKDGRNDEDRLNAILQNLPDLIFITGGTDGGVTHTLKTLIEPIKLALQVLDPTRRPLLLYAGNQALVDWVKAYFEEVATVFIADNVRPKMNEEALDMALVRLAQVYDQHKEQHSAAYKSVSAISITGIQPTAISYSLITEYFARHLDANVLTLDMGSATTTIIGAFNGDLDTTINTTMGLGFSADTLLQQVGYDAVRQWLPFPITRLQLRQYAMNKVLRPMTIPRSMRELYLEHALLRAGLQDALNNARPTWRGVTDETLLPPIGLVLVGGAALAQTGNPGMSMLLVADTVQPAGITEVKADPHGLISALGTVARINPEAVVQLLDGNNLDHLGTLISAHGNIREGRTAVKLKITTQDGEVFEHSIDGGEMWLLPLPIGRELALDIQCARGIHIGNSRRIKRTFYGGLAGILFDMRGRPMPVGLRVEDRVQHMPAWLSQATGEEPVPIPEDWLIAQEEEPDDIVIGALDEEDEGGGLRLRRRNKKNKAQQTTETAKLETDDDGDFLAMIDDDDTDFDDEDDEQGDELDDLRKLL